MLPLETDIPHSSPHGEVPVVAERPRRHLWLFKSAGVAMLAFYGLLMVIGILMAWLQLLGIMPVLLLSASVFGLMHGAYRLVIEGDDDGPLDDLAQERDGRRRRRKIVFFI